MLVTSPRLKSCGCNGTEKKFICKDKQQYSFDIDASICCSLFIFVSLHLSTSISLSCLLMYPNLRPLPSCYQVVILSFNPNSYPHPLLSYNKSLSLSLIRVFLIIRVLLSSLLSRLLMYPNLRPLSAARC